jgi:phospho-N-acetylmuramoyl-pentapeptide-transferase
MIILTFLISLSLTVIIEKQLIPYLKSKAAQPIYETGPAWHMSKSGTPTMGGLAFLIGISASLLVFCIVSGEVANVISAVLISLCFAVANSVIGIVDDLTKIKKKENAGLKPYEKLILQFLVAVIFLMARKFFLGDDTALTFSSFEIDLGWLYYPLAIIIILGTTNCANLTDGIDGLASSVAIAIGFSFLFLGGVASKETALISSAVIGGSLGFLFFNRHPAQIFMGDTGSLFLGGLATALAFSFNNPVAILFLGGVYTMEGLSVILQVIYFRLTKKRLFKMAPLHHHMEKCGIGENKICIYAICLTALLTVLAAFIFKI